MLSMPRKSRLKRAVAKSFMPRRSKLKRAVAKSFMPRKSRLKRAVAKSFEHHGKAVKVHNKVEVVQVYIIFCKERHDNTIVLYSS